MIEDTRYLELGGYPLQSEIHTELELGTGNFHTSPAPNPDTTDPNATTDDPYTNPHQPTHLYR